MVNDIFIQPSEEKPGVRIATVTELFELGTAKITFYGEDAPSEKEYSYLASYSPVVGDKVLLLPMLDTYIIAGKIMFGIEPTPDITEDDIVQMLESYVTTGELDTKLDNYAKASDLAGYALSTHIHNALRLNSHQGGFLTTVNNIPVFCTTSDSIPLGNSDYKWKEVYAKNGTILTSDERYKKDIEVPDERYLDLLLDLKPVRYKMKDGESDRYHLGYISQDIEEDLERNNLDSKEFAGFIKSPTEKDGEIDYNYALRHEEFGPLYALGIQTLFKVVGNLRAEIDALKKGDKV